MTFVFLSSRPRLITAPALVAVQKRCVHATQSSLGQHQAGETPIKAKNVPVFTFAKSMVTRSKRRLYVWGYASLGALGEPQFIEPLAGTQLANVVQQRTPWRLRWVDRMDAEVSHVACGNGFSLIAISDAKELKGHHLFGTGMNTHSQIGVHLQGRRRHSAATTGEPLKYIIQPVHIDLPLDSSSSKKKEQLRILDISCGRTHSLVLTNQGLVSLGSNVYGQCARPLVDDEECFGNPAVVQNVSKHVAEALEPDDSVVAVKAGQDHSCLVTRKGRVLTCGWSADGQLGRGIYTMDARPRPVGGDLAKDDVSIQQVATKGDFVLALSASGELFGWGNNEYKQLSMSGSLEPQIGEPMHLKLPAYVRRPVLKVAASGTHCLAIDADRRVWTWGFGLLGKGPAHSEFAEPSEIPATIFGCYPEIEHSQSKHAVSVDCGLNSSSVTFSDGSLYMWGRNKYGSLGTGDSLDAFMPLRVNMPASAVRVEIGADQTFAICKANV